MLTGRRLFDGGSMTDVLAAVVKEPVPFDALPAATPARIRHLLTRCLERDPRRRLRDMGEARIALEDPGGADDAGQVVPVAARGRLLQCSPGRSRQQPSRSPRGCC